MKRANFDSTQHISGEYSNIYENIKQKPAIEISEYLATLELQATIGVLLCFTRAEQADIYSDFSNTIQLDIFNALKRREFSKVFIAMKSDDRVDFYQSLTAEQQASLLPFLDKATREDVYHLNLYDPECAGGIMSTDFASIREQMTVSEAIEKVRRDSPSKKTIYYVYVVDSNKTLRGFVTLKDLILAKPEELVKNILHDDFAWANIYEDQEIVAKKIEKYDLVAIPVLNNEMQLAGIVTHDDAIEIIRAEQTEDLEKLMGIIPDENEYTYSQTSAWGHFKKRVLWILSLAIMGLISGVILHSYEEALESLIILALYMPMVADTGGNSGSQAATVVIRALALGDIKLSDWFKVIFKEARVGFMLSLCLGLVTLGKVSLLSNNAVLPEGFSLLQVGSVIALALSLQVIVSTIIGATMPLIVKRLNGDPAVVASPAITTIVDITGMLIYFGTATFFLF